MRSRDYKVMLEDAEEKYQDAYDEEFNDQFRDFLDECKFTLGNTITEEDVQGFIDSFTFPDVAEWCNSEVESQLDDIADAKYEAMKDER